MHLIVIGNWFGVDKVFRSMFDSVTHIDNVDELQENKAAFTDKSIVLFGGGADISPSLYGQVPTRYTHAREQLSERDYFEVEVYKVAKAANSGFIGICRGAQLLCAMAGGSLYQHVDNHGIAHGMQTTEGTVLRVSSAHHQMMNPKGTKHELLGWSEAIRSGVHITEHHKDVEVEVEPEVILFPEIKALAIQYHPEFMSADAPAVLYSKNLVKQHLMTGA